MQAKRPEKLRKIREQYGYGCGVRVNEGGNFHLAWVIGPPYGETWTIDPECEAVICAETGEIITCRVDSSYFGRAGDKQEIVIDNAIDNMLKIIERG